MPISQIILFSCQGAAALSVMTATPQLQTIPQACNAFFTPAIVQTTYNFYPYMNSW
jgi:hypothetical protein